MRYPLLIVLGVVAALAAFAGTSHAAGALHSDGGSLLELLQPLYDAFSGRNYWEGASLVVVLFVALTKRYGAPRLEWLRTDWAGALMALLAAFAGTVGVSVADGQAMTLDIVERAFTIAVGAAGGYTVLKHTIIVPLLRPLVAKLPVWMQGPLVVLLGIFDGDSKSTTSAPADAGNTPTTPSV